MNLLRFAHVAKRTNLGLYFKTSAFEWWKMAGKGGEGRSGLARYCDFQGIGREGMVDADGGRFSSFRCEGRDMVEL